MRIDNDHYAQVLERCTFEINNKISNTDISSVQKDKLIDIIMGFVVANKDVRVDGLTHDELALYLYHDMAELGFISREALFEQEGFEELNVNSWDDVDIGISGRQYKTDFRFLSPEHAINVHERMLRMTKVPFDRAAPRAIADIGGNIRICAQRAPIVDENVAVASSIRKVKSGFVSKDELLKWGTASEEMITFLLLCLRYGISVCVSGETGAGKTTLAGALIAIVAQKLRTITIEEGSREWQFRIPDKENGGYKNSVVHMKTRPNEKDELNITQETLVKDALRLDPAFLPIGEIRGSEAFEIMGASNTGHTVITTIHSNGTADTPLRLITLAKKAYDMSDNTLLSMAAQAFPILVHVELCPDKVRRITEIAEVVEYDGNIVHQNMLYEFLNDDTIHDGTSVNLINPHFKRVGDISTKMFHKMLKKGAGRAVLKTYYEEDET